MRSARNEVLSLWTVYERPLDYPDKWVARRFELDRPTSEYIVFESAGAVHEHFALRRLFWLPRHSTDPTSIMGTYF